MLEDLFLVIDFVLKGDASTLVDVADDFEALTDDRGIELDLREDCSVRMEVDRRPRSARGARLLQRTRWLAAFERHLPGGAVAFDARAQLPRQRVDHAGAHAVQATGSLVIALLELSTRVEHREDDFERTLLRLRVLVHRNAAAVVAHRYRAAVLVQRQRDVRGVAVHRFVYGVVEDFPHQVMQAGGAHTSDVHRSEEHTSELQSLAYLVCRLLLE